MIERNQPEDSRDVRVNSNDFEVAITDTFKDLKENMVKLRE